mgnify:CR=1 FL=1
MKKGERLRIRGGVYGTVVAVDTNAKTSKVEVDKNVRSEFDKAAIAVVIPSGKDSEDKEPAAGGTLRAALADWRAPRSG